MSEAVRVEATAIPDVKVVVPERHGDARGSFSEVWNRRALEAAGLVEEFVQDNQAWSAEPGTVRGLHFQAPPHAQAKLIRVAAGRVLDVVVDIRRGSETYGRHVAVELSRENGKQLWVPEGFAHGYCTIERDTVVEYKVTAYYAPESDRDRGQPALAELESPFEMGDAAGSSADARSGRSPQ